MTWIKGLKIVKKITGQNTSENDIRLIAYAKLNSFTVVTQERDQRQEPTNISHFKIPLICQKEEVTCINFVDFLSEMKIRI